MTFFAYFYAMAKTGYYLRYAIDPRQETVFPLNWAALFERNAPLAVEIGFGNGAYLVEWARQQPQWNFVGIELSGECMERLQKRIAAEKLSHVRPIRENARFALREFFPDNSIRQVTMNYPDPWPKEKHRRRRLLNEQFVAILAAVLAPGGIYELVTDQEWYAHHAADLFQHSECFETGPVELNPVRPVVTKYEQKWKKMGRQSYRVVATKLKSTPITRLLEDYDMPHAFINLPISDAVVQALEGVELVEGTRWCIIKGSYLKLGTEQYMLNVVARDDDFQQNFYLQITPREDGKWLVKLDSAQPPYRTPAVKMAIWRIGEILSGKES